MFPILSATESNSDTFLIKPEVSLTNIVLLFPTLFKQQQGYISLLVCGKSISSTDLSFLLA